MYSPKRSLIGLMAIVLFMSRCGNAAVDVDDRPNANEPYIVKETVATGDSGITKLSGIKRVNELDILCQHWEVGKTEGANSPELLQDEEDNKLHPGLDIFTDSSFVANPRGAISMGTWRIQQEGKDLRLVLTGTDQKQTVWHINELSSRSLRLVATDESGRSLYLNLSSDGMIHKNNLNDPFHPVNNQWRIKPAQPESDSAIAARAKGCVKFYALFYRDNIKRQKDRINFAGLPLIFQWYRRGIGLPDWDEINDSWVNCFYDKDQARKGYDVLRQLIVNYEFEWHKGLPDWRMETESVLEQMYNKM